ncbi:hypothetical protein NLU13_3534 [Sarocladium strictum]|uniref:Uncharacterized protein n=1 Tax=Sarocladium strictum TaxID=5046 RepID=A0AA39GMI4_SARSR|nr:hypothetical protein NLU13_3534 [Sarocladium strictum]
MADNGTSATDIITYIGVPLAVLGVLPILYNTFATLGSLARIRRMLRYNHLTAVTRSDVVNRVIEVELPRFAIMPVDRLENPEAYWTLSRTPSLLPGGSWTIFNWRTNMIGVRAQRIEYADQVRQPQAEVSLDSLVSYLLDLGAIPSPHGWHLLRTAGLWAPVGCPLMTSPDGRAKVLSIAPLDDSDGHLSLALSWSSTWTTRDESSLPPFWVKLPCPRSRASEIIESGARSQNKSKLPETRSETETLKGSSEIVGKGKGAYESGKPGSLAGISMDNGDGDSITRQAKVNEKSDIICQVRESGVVSALVPKYSQGLETSYGESLYIDHLRISRSSTVGTWFATAATAYNSSSRTVLWDYRIPEGVSRFSRRDSIPCGVLELLSIVSDSETPKWATEYNDEAERHDRIMRKSHDQLQIVMKEKNMSPEEKNRAALERMMQESRNMLQEMRDSERRKQQRAEKRMFEAFQSPKWDTGRAANFCLAWLKSRNIPAQDVDEVGESSSNPAMWEKSKSWHDDITIQEAVGNLLHRMVLDGELASAVSQVLDAWQAWSEVGGMRQADYEMIRERTELFAQAVLLMALVKQCGQEAEGSLAADLQECFRVWKVVRLG